MSALRRLIGTTSLALVLPLTAIALAAEPIEPSLDGSQLNTYTKPGGETYFSLSLTPPANLPQPTTQDVVVLFDTSASQVGPYREKALTSLEKMLAGLGANDRVRLFAVDLDAVPMSSGFVAPDSDEMKAALAKLAGRTPLGSTDMALALRSGAASFGDDSVAPRSLIYIGDGMSSANLLETEDFAELVQTLVTERVAASSYAIGPESNNRMLAALANQTGGMLAISRDIVWASDPVGDESAISRQRADQENARLAAEVGDYLAKAARGVVLWPTHAAWPESFSEVYPATMPPLRGDRDTVVIGKGTPGGPLVVGMTVEAAGEEIELQWSVQPSASSPDHAYLVHLVDSARSDRGVTLPTVGTAGLQAAEREITATVESLTMLASHAVATGNLEDAELFADQALGRDPGNPVALAVQRNVKKSRTDGKVGVVAAQVVKLAQADAPRGDAQDITALDEEGQAGSFLETFDNRKGLITGQVRADVEATLSDARRRMATDPTGVIQVLKQTLQSVRRVPELDPELRAQLADRIETALREADRQEIVKEEINRQTQERMASAAAELAIVESLNRREQQKKQLMDRLAALMKEGQYESAADEVAPEVRRVAPNSTAAVSAKEVSEISLYADNIEAIRRARDTGYMQTFETVERSSIPFRDDRPIVYPDTQVWRELTERRKKYESVDLTNAGGAEKRIREALEELTTVGFIEQPLEDAITELEQLHDINIELDRKALEDFGVTTDTPITANLSGIKLRSALRLMLREHLLTYIIRDEVLLITTVDEANLHVTTKVYPVADLVLPIVQLGGGGGGGGLGGGGGGLGGGGGGFGGGGGGGGRGGGGGGGFFNVPDDIAPSKAKSTERSASEKPTAINVDESVAAEKFWNDYFAAHRADPAAVRQTVRKLTEAGKLDHVVALIHGALRGGQPQPWMYEAISLAMQLNNQPESEIERALMSAADFAQSADQLMQLARYLERVGLDARALQVYQQVTKVEPTRHEPYMLGLDVAKRLDDPAGIRWATIGVLGQAWIGDEAKTMQSAVRIARATLSELKASEKHEEAEAYQKVLDEAVIRDCVVQVTWTGEADIDLLVEEPTGTICSSLDPRTVAGGVMLGNVYSQGGRSSTDVSSETYVCTKGFSGEYRVLLRRVWGDVTAGKATVDIYLHYRTGEVLHERQQVALGDTDAAVVFNLDGGRRQEPLNERQVATAASQIVNNRAVLAQQISSLSDQDVTTVRPIDIALARRGVLGRGGAVGFQPITTTLPEGTNLIATAVVSADRRYVRITVAPLFSAIGDVTTFTFNGAGGQGQGAGFGGGGGGGLGGGGGGGLGGGGGGGLGGGF